jgi:endo-1,4-beta-xylanase
MQRTAAGQAPAYDRVAAVNSVSDGAWVRLEGQYTFPTTASDLLIYVESPSATAGFLIDDFELVRTAPAPTGPVTQDNSGLKATFESGDNNTEGWLPRIGGERLEVTRSDKRSGEASLLVSNRTRAFEGARIDASGKMYNGSQYQIRAWVKLAAPSNETVAPSQLRLSLERSYQGANTYYTAVPNTRVTTEAWVELSGVYTVAFPFDRLNLYIESAEGSASFLLDDFELTYIPPVEIQKDIPSVAETLSSYFPVGAAIGPGALSGAHLDLLKKHFSAVTAENAMKWESLQPREGEFTWANAHTLMRFAASNGMKARGHTLVWHEQVPAWVFRDAATGDPLPPGEESSKQVVLERMRTHIREVMTRYKDEVFAWDVVNEAIDPAQPDCMRRSPWFTYTGLDFVDEAFRLARELNPEAKLFYNDYDTTNPNRRRCMVNLIRGMKERGVPVDGIGHQMHVNIEYPSIPAIAETLDLFYDELGIENHITELDMSVYTNSTATYQTVPEEILTRQGRRYAELFELFRSKAGKITSVTFWGLADDNTWLKSFPIRRLDLPLLFDEKLQAKPAYWGVVDPSKLP